ncbi:MAG TPA: hypothetical protein VFA81_08485 [Burkholderiales bacterium]|nr:hypothetical protein [Burkholderiales bacterium]
MKLKRGEERQLEGLFGAEDDGPIPKLRIDVANASPSATSLGIRIHENVEVPADSFVMAAFNNPGRVYRGEEKFDRWRTSNGALGQGTMFVEAIGRGGRDVSCLLTFLTGARGGRPRSTRPAA